MDNKKIFSYVDVVEAKEIYSEPKNESNTKIENQRNVKDLIDFMTNEPEIISKKETNLNSENKNFILNVLVVGFHHKKGCQIDYCYPALKNNDENDQSYENSPTNKLPNPWKTLPSIALPDGAHNYDRDTIYFHLPDPVNVNETVYGISCYRQISADKLKEKNEEVTRGTVQKSVVVISKLPLYGLIAVKCEMITYAYFNECDFSKIDCLKELYTNLNHLVKEELLSTSEVFLGLSPRDLILNFSHKIIVLFKLILLEKKVLFHKSPVKELCTTILTLISLFPGMIENGGLNNSSSNVQQKQQNDRKFSSDIELIEEELIIVENNENNIKINNIMLVDDAGKNNISMFCSNNKIGEELTNKSSLDSSDLSKSNEEIIEAKEIDPLVKYRDGNVINPKTFFLGDENYTPLLFKLSLKDCGFPLNIFKRRSYCHPYLSLAYLDILKDKRVNSFVVGATNYLFKQKRNLFDVIVEVDGAKIDIINQDLKKKLQLSTEDLRFADYLVKCIEENGTKGDVSKTFDGTSWEGGDEWLRYQFKIYLVQLLVTSKTAETSKEYYSFNSFFLNAWKETINYKTWSNLNLLTFETIAPGHPFYGQLSISDMKIRLNHAMNNTERGKKINQTVLQTGKAVGTAINSAKTVVYSWWSQLGTKNLDLDKNITNSDTNLNTIDNQASSDLVDGNNSANKTNTGLKLSNSFNSFSFSTLLKTCEESENSPTFSNEQKNTIDNSSCSIEKN